MYETCMNIVSLLSRTLTPESFFRRLVGAPFVFRSYFCVVRLTSYTKFFVHSITNAALFLRHPTHSHPIQSRSELPSGCVHPPPRPCRPPPSRLQKQHPRSHQRPLPLQITLQSYSQPLCPQNIQKRCCCFGAPGRHQ
jgi:hypothetical protein